MTSNERLSTPELLKQEERKNCATLRKCSKSYLALLSPSTKPKATSTLCTRRLSILRTDTQTKSWKIFTK